jgi:hypothetical protein
VFALVLVVVVVAVTSPVRAIVPPHFPPAMCGAWIPLILRARNGDETFQLSPVEPQAPAGRAHIEGDPVTYLRFQQPRCASRTHHVRSPLRTRVPARGLAAMLPQAAIFDKQINTA